MFGNMETQSCLDLIPGSKVHIKHCMLHLKGMRGRLKVLGTVAASAVVHQTEVGGVFF